MDTERGREREREREESLKRVKKESASLEVEGLVGVTDARCH